MVMRLRLVPAPLRRRILDSAEVPSDLASVTTIDRDEEHPPSAVGMTRDGVEAIWRATERLYATGILRNCPVCVCNGQTDQRIDGLGLVPDNNHRGWIPDM